MPNSTLALKASVPRRDPAAVQPDLKARLADLQRQQLEEVRQAAEPEPAARPEPPAPDRPKRDPNALQSAFLAENLNKPVTVYLMSGIKRVGTLKQFDQFTLWLQGPDGIKSMIFKQVINTVLPGTARNSTR
jgi:RNA chaperone Hfq